MGDRKGQRGSSKLFPVGTKIFDFCFERIDHQLVVQTQIKLTIIQKLGERKIHKESYTTKMSAKGPLFSMIKAFS